MHLRDHMRTLAFSQSRQCPDDERNTCVAYTDERIDVTTLWLPEVESRAL